MKKRILCRLFALMFLCACFVIESGQAQNGKGESEILAVINGERVITRTEVDALIGSQLYSLQEKIYRLRRNILDNLITKILLEEEAKLRNTTVDKLKDQLMPDQVEIKQSQIDQVYAENAGTMTNMDEDEAKERIRLELESRAKMEKYKSALAEIRNKTRIDLSLAEPPTPLVKVSAEGPSKGNKNAGVTIVEFSDFQCPYCKQVTGTLSRLLQTYGEDVKLVFKHMPLSIHPQAFKAAQAAVCADMQGKFWQYHDRLFRSNDMSVGALGEYAKALGLNINEFNLCLDSETSHAVVLKNMQEARQADINSTPTFIINGKVLKGAKSEEDFRRAIDQELNNRRKASTATSN